MRGEHGLGADRLDGGVETDTLFTFEFPYAFKTEETGVSLVGVEHLGVGVTGQPAVRPHGADPADAEQHLLEQPVVAATAVEPVGHLAGGGVVVLDVGVEQQQRDPSDAGLPDVRVQRPAAGQAQGHPGGRGVGLADEGEGELVGIEDGVVLLLPAVTGEGLAEVAVAVEQSHADERDAEVAGGLEVVAREDPEPAGVLRQGCGDAELGREVGDGGGQVPAVLVGLVPPPAVDVVIEVGGGHGQPPQEPPVAA